MPSHMAMKKGALQQRQMVELLHALRRHDIQSRASLAAAWLKDQSFLKLQLLECVKKPHQRLLLQLWPQMLSQAQQSAEQPV